MQKARGGLGSAKHGKGGNPGPSPGSKLARAREANRESASVKKPKPKYVKSVKELFHAKD